MTNQEALLGGEKSGLEIAATKILAVLINADAENDDRNDSPKLVVSDWK
jgi:hypothetical protein